jgi:hypothetical protein
MIITEKKRVALAVGVALSGIPPASPICRLARAQVIFPDIGEPRTVAIGFHRYPGELSIVKPTATKEELAVPPGLTIDL